MALGVPAIALSQMMRYSREDERAPFGAAAAFGPGLVSRLVALGWPDDVILNINFPAMDPSQVSEVEVTRQGFRNIRTRFAEQRTDLRGRDYYWLGYRNEPSQPPSGTDLRAAYEGRISVTPLHIDLTHMETVHALKAAVGGAPPKLAAKT